MFPAALLPGGAVGRPPRRLCDPHLLVATCRAGSGTPAPQNRQESIPGAPEMSSKAGIGILGPLTLFGQSASWNAS